jgi:hypothetical protein
VRDAQPLYRDREVSGSSHVGRWRAVVRECRNVRV